jgi:hypothetical protein
MAARITQCTSQSRRRAWARNKQDSPASCSMPHRIAQPGLLLASPDLSSSTRSRPLSLRNCGKLVSLGSELARLTLLCFVVSKSGRGLYHCTLVYILGGLVSSFYRCSTPWLLAFNVETLSAVVVLLSSSPLGYTFYHLSVTASSAWQHVI